MNNIPALPFYLFQQRLKKLQPIPNHLSTVHTLKLIDEQYWEFTEGDLYPVYPVHSDFLFQHKIHLCTGLRISLQDLTKPGFHFFIIRTLQ